MAMAATLNLTSPSPKPPISLHISSGITPFFQSYPLPRHISTIPSISIRPNNNNNNNNNRTISKPRYLSITVSALGKLSETEPVTVPTESELIPGSFPSTSGVYAVFNGDNDLQFVGISRNVAASVVSHKKSVPELCYSVKVGVVEDPDRTALTQAWKSWMEEHIAATGKVPPGNETGNTTWARQPPKRKGDLRLTPGRHVQLTIPLEELIDKLVKENKVVAFIKGTRTAPLCGFSQRVVAILESVGADYDSVDVLDEEYNCGLRETLKSYSNWPTFPQVFVDGELLGGCDILTAMYENGELANMLKK